MAGSDDEATPPGWYRQQDDPGTLRWWDGSDWTDDSMPAPTALRPGGPARAPRERPADGRPATAQERAAARERAESRPRPTPDAGTPIIRIGEAGAARASDAPGPPAISLTPDPAPTPSPRPTPRPATMSNPAARKAPASGSAARKARGSGRATGSVRPPPPPGDDRPRAANWPDDDDAPTGPAHARPARTAAGRPTAGRPTSRPGTARNEPPRRLSAEPTHRVVARGGADGPHLGRVLARAALALLVLAVGWFGYTKIRDAGPGDADTLGTTATTVDRLDPKAIPLPNVVLDLNDLPAGWAVQAYDASVDDVCGGKIPRSVLTPVELQSASFTQGSAGPFVTNVVARFANVETAKHFMDLTEQTVDSCRRFEDNGSKITLGPLSFPEFDDETFAAKATGTSPFGALRGDIIYIRHGSRVASIQTISFGDSNVSEELVATLTQKVARRL